MIDIEILKLMEAAIHLEVSTIVSPNDSMYQGNDRHYFGVGRSALLNVVTGLLSRLSYQDGESQIRTILDYGCGHGRVARYLRAAFTKAEIEVADINRDGVEWCIAHLSCEDMGEVIPKDRYDLIWVGSVLTHLPEREVKELLHKLALALRPNGVMLVTTHGRYSLLHLDAYARGETEPDMPVPDYGIPRDAASLICAECYRTGFGYHDYPGANGYGIAVMTPEWLLPFRLDAQLVLLAAQEVAWDCHQDMFVFMRADPLRLRRGGYF